MAEPNSTAIGIVVGAGIGLTGTVMGAQVDALIVGLVAAILISFWLPSINDRKRATAAVALSSLLAGYGSPVAAAYLAGEKYGLPAGSPLRLLLALVIGIACPAGIPMVLGWVKRKSEA